MKLLKLLAGVYTGKIKTYNTRRSGRTGLTYLNLTVTINANGQKVDFQKSYCLDAGKNMDIIERLWKDQKSSVEELLQDIQDNYSEETGITDCEYQIEKLKRESERLKNRMSNLVDMKLDDLIGSEEFEDKKCTIDERMLQIKNELAILSQDEEDNEPVEVEGEIKKIKEYLNGVCDLNQKQLSDELVDAVIARITPMENGAFKWYIQGEEYDTETLDVSNMHLLNHANDFGWGELRMLNLYATVVNGKPSVSQLQGNSLAYIEEILETKDIKTYDIVVAWGNSMATHKNTIKAKIDLLSMLMEKGLSAKCITVDCLSTKKSYGIHPLYLGLHYPKDKWKLIDFPVKEMLEELEKSLKTDKTSEKKKTKKVEKKVKSTEKSAEGRAGE